MQGGFRKLLPRRPGHFVLGTQPLTQPFPGVLFHCPVGFADRTEAKVVRPPNDHAVEGSYHRALIEQGLVSSGFAADCLTHASHPLLRWNSAQTGPPSLRRVAASKRITQENQTSLPATGRPASSSRSPSTSASA